MTDLTNMYYHRLKIHVLRNNLTFIEDVRDRYRWTVEFLRARETVVMEELPVDTVTLDMRDLMYSHGLDMQDQCRVIWDLFDGTIRWEQVCQSW
jgi:hypothetical protein